MTLILYGTSKHASLSRQRVTSMLHTLIHSTSTSNNQTFIFNSNEYNRDTRFYTKATNEHATPHDNTPFNEYDTYA